MACLHGGWRQLGKVFIIAEAGVNHNGDAAAAMRMVDAAAECGADAVKFQTFAAERMISVHAPKAAYQRETTGDGESQLEMVRRLELDAEAHRVLIGHCEERGIMFMSTPFDVESVDLLAGLGLGIFKVPSGEITNLPLLRRVGAPGRRVIVSTGMAEMREVGAALEVLEGAGTRRCDVTVLQCNTEYPTPYEDANLLAMLTMRYELGVAVGYSDHTLGIEVAVAAAALGAAVIEKHFTLDRDMAGPDHRASLEPDELAAMVRAIRNVEKAMGDGVKAPSRSEMANMAAARKSIVAARSIRRGEVITHADVAVKRPGTGMSPMRWDEICGMKAARYFARDELIEAEGLV